MILILSKTKLTNNPGLMLILRLECMTLLQNQDFLLIISVGRGGGGGWDLNPGSLHLEN